MVVSKRKNSRFELRIVDIVTQELQKSKYLRSDLTEDGEDDTDTQKQF